MVVTVLICKQAGTEPSWDFIARKFSAAQLLFGLNELGV